MAATGSIARTISGLVFVGIVAAISILIFVLIWLTVSPASAFWALIDIGVVALVFSFTAYFLQAVVNPPLVARAANWGYLAMGFTVIFVTIGAYPDTGIGTTLRLYLFLPFLILFAIAVGGIYWRSGQHAAERHRSEERAAWQSQPSASAFNYAAAQPATVPPPGASGTPPAPPAQPGR